jgi:hypothetical protein
MQLRVLDPGERVLKGRQGLALVGHVHLTSIIAGR